MKLALLFIIAFACLLLTVSARYRDEHDMKEEMRERIESRMKSRRDSMRDHGSRRHHPRSHEERSQREKEDNMKHRQFVRERADKYHGRIQAAGFEDSQKSEYASLIEELHSLEVGLAESRLQITVDFDGAREITDKDRRRAYLDEKKAKREIQREKDNVSRERIKEIRNKLDGDLKAKEKNEL